MTTYEQVGKSIKLSPHTLRRFVTYMRRRWPSEETLQCQTGYAKEWAWRFQRGMEAAASDHEGQGVLHQMEDKEAKR
mgnify:CR=1 FL=1